MYIYLFIHLLYSLFIVTPIYIIFDDEGHRPKRMEEINE